MIALTQARERIGWTRFKLGAKAEIHPARVGDIERGRATPPRDGVELKRLAAALGWQGEPGDLLNEVSHDER
jgi:ribosome-binding protein aMBF1 (putative translation factor)